MLRLRGKIAIILILILCYVIFYFNILGTRTIKEEVVENGKVTYEFEEEDVIKYIDKKVKKIYLKKVEDEDIIKVETSENKIIDFYDLSQGTKKFLMIMYSIIRVIQNEGILICDEIENSLHIDLVRFILKMFTIDNNAAQVIYTSNTENAMDEEIIRKEYASSDSDISVQIMEEEEGIFQILDEQSLKKVLFYFHNIPNGVIFMNQDIPGLVETSLNLGILTVNSYKAECHISVRSSVASRKKLLLEKLSDMAEQVGAQMSVSGEYPEWGFRRESKLRETMKMLYHEMYAEELKVDVIHAGLECGYLLQKKPELDIISFGPQMYDIHTTEERLSISSVNKIYAFVKRLIETGIRK